jgi:hypothetical protein
VEEACTNARQNSSLPQPYVLQEYNWETYNLAYPLTLIGQVHTQVDIIKPRGLYLEGYITNLERLTHNLPCVSLPTCNSTSAAQCSKQNSMFLLYYSIRSWDQKVSTLWHRQRRCCKNWKLKEAHRISIQQQHGAGGVTTPPHFTSDGAGEQPALFVKEQQGGGFTCHLLLLSRHSNLLTSR